MFDRILIPLDGSPNSEKIRHWVVDLAAELKSAVDLLAVIDPSKLQSVRRYGTASEMAEQSAEELEEEETEYARSYLRTQADWFQERGVTVAGHVVTGDPPEQIITQSYELNAQLIAMTTRRRSTLVRGVLGSVADRVLHAAGIPVLLVRPGDVAGFKDGGGLPGTVVVPIDGSDFSERAIPYAEAIAMSSAGRVLFVNGRAPNASYAQFAMSDPAQMPDHEGGHAAKMNAYLDSLVKRSARHGIQAEFHRSWKTAANAIIESTSESEDRMVVMTSHGASGVRRWLLGSVADTVIRSSEHPILVIPPEHQQVTYRGQSARRP
ncbi:MAG: universal stress protein [Chloroflexi bacterium]|nr:universal stress protein [Chloroflexota bacterium]